MGSKSTGDPTSAADLRPAIETAHEAFVAMDAGGFVSDWNPEAERTFGWSRDEAIGKVLADLFIPPAYREQHWAGLQKFLDTGEGPVLGKRLELSAIHREGFEFPVELTISAATVDDKPVFYAFLHDISERKRAETYTATQYAAAKVLAEATDPDGAAHALLPALGESLEWEIGAWWAVQENEGAIACREIWTAPDVDGGSFGKLTHGLVLQMGEGLPGRVWETR